MPKIKVMIVDDSPFSRTVIGESFSNIGCEVVGEVDSIDNLVEIYAQCNPDIVTMDLVMPGADGFECSEALLQYDPNVKIILLSSLKDEETEAEAKRIGIVGYIQKPLEEELLERIIQNILAPDDLYNLLENKGAEIFKESLAQIITRTTKKPVNYTDIDYKSEVLSSQGITTIIGIIGRYTGTMILDLSFELAESFVESMLNRPSKSQDELFNMVAELANIIAGSACSMLNKQNKSFGLRVSPPSVFSAESAQISNPNLNLQVCNADTGEGNIFLGIGFRKGTVLWM